MGEGADDAGGVFDDTITEMCIELTNGSLPFLIPTPNSVNILLSELPKLVVGRQRIKFKDNRMFVFCRPMT